MGEKQTYLELILQRLNNHAEVKLSQYDVRLVRHLEDELLSFSTAIYRERKPDGFPDGNHESIGRFRNLYKTHNASYQGIKVRTGEFRLHVKYGRPWKNLIATSLIYMGEGITADLPQDWSTTGGKPALHARSEVAYAALLDNGVVAACYFDASNPDKRFILTYHPEGKTSDGTYEFPNSAREVVAKMKEMLENKGITPNENAIRALGNLTMLAVQTSKKSPIDH